LGQFAIHLASFMMLALFSQMIHHQALRRLQQGVSFDAQLGSNYLPRRHAGGGGGFRAIQ
jgi:hypothetical protein